VGNELHIVNSQSDNSIKLKRSMALFVDLLIWYLIYILVVFVLFLFTNGIPTISGNLMFCKEQINSIITSSNFIIVYVGALLLYEIVVTILNNGQSVSKRIFNLRVLCGKDKMYLLALRGVIKIVILNPYGIIAYLCNQMIPLISINAYADIILFILAGSTGVTLCSRKGNSVHDMISHTCVVQDHNS
jgi:uncharacterized RDD family membrane protein YckC